ncbi:hypothetical protein JAAARDRAFT_528346 [Jaapia argillacea MUCL 33604]|uniref:Uncharacterized protein n=1 Tax=Jaapia argillacea MUCL 33604 TaxID=933084 RepID=A0A067Q749_9AGAM|nr:hypothetical protein JAAARDRAFT_528346 [Jaapia argillacea MUCL 33604]
MLTSAASHNFQHSDGADDEDDGTRNDPAIKTIIGFSINPVSTLNAQTYPELSEAEISLAEALPLNRYVGLLDDVHLSLI